VYGDAVRADGDRDAAVGAGTAAAKREATDSRILGLEPEGQLNAPVSA
jgi:hypothetical protein